MNLELLKDYDILICSNRIKDYVIKNRQLLNIKIYTLDEFISKYLFSYDDNTIIYLMDKYNYCVDVAIMYLNELYYVNEYTGNKKIDFLVDMKNELIKENLLICNHLFRNYVSDKKIIVCDIDNKLLSSVIENLDYIVYDYKYNEYNHDVIEFNSMSEEIEYVAYQICSLISNGISPKNICLTNISNNYYHDLNRIFSLYNLHVNIKNKMPLSSSKIGKIFLSNMDIDSILEYKDSLEYNKIVDILNSTINCNHDKRIIDYKMRHTYIYSMGYDNGIDILDYNNEFLDRNYVFMLNFNEGIIPNVVMDIDYISDNLCKYTLKEESYIINERKRKDVINIVSDIKNLTITYKLSDDKDVYYPSSLIDKYNVIHDKIDEKITYSRKYDMLKLSNYMDYYIKYGTYSEYLDLLLHNYDNLYNSYSNKYTCIDKKWDKLELSYSSLNKYNECSFKYYISYVLRIDKYEDSFASQIGSIIHLILKESYSLHFDLDDIFNKIIKEYNFNYKELFYLNKYKELLRNVIATIKEQNSYISLDKYLLEEEIVTNISDKVGFRGIIDKILYKEFDDKTIVSLIDYKTGSDNISLNYLKYGLNMQLPIYLYLASKLSFKNITYAGFYLQKINENNQLFKLEGYSNSDVNILSYFDNNYMDSLMIKSMKVKNDGNFYSNSKVLSSEEINNIIDNVYNEINSKSDMIINNEFNINPKVINDINYGCRYCKYRDICFVTNNDYVIIREDADYE